MNFISTRGGKKVTGAEAIVKGLAENGGLYVPEKFPKITKEELEKMAEMNYAERAAFVLGKYLADDLGEAFLLETCEKALPKGFEAQIRPRSGLAIKKGIGVLNSPGTIDADYRGEICIILVNLSSEDFVVEDGERVAQMVIARHEQAEWQEVEILDETERGAGGFGHTGEK